jgi:hypothetical protein
MAEDMEEEDEITVVRDVVCDDVCEPECDVPLATMFLLPPLPPPTPRELFELVVVMVIL